MKEWFVGWRNFDNNHIIESRTLYIQERQAALDRHSLDWDFRAVTEREIHACKGEIIEAQTHLKHKKELGRE